MPPAISVIVPVYNIASDLRRSVDSILCQTMTDLEILLIDDGSTDSSGAICDEYAVKDARVRVIHKENGGLANVRNVGMREARGDYFTFVDGDDYIDPDMMERQYQLAREYQADVVCCSFEGQREPGPLAPPERREIRTITWREFAPGLLQGEQMYSAMWNKLYRRELAEGLHNDEDICFTEDRLANCRGLRTVEKIVMDNAPRYHYMIRGDSLVQHSLSERQFTALEAARRVMELEKDEPEFLPYCRRQRDIILMSLITRIIKADAFWERYPELRAEIMKDYDAIMKSGLYTRKEKMTALLLKYCPWAYRAAVRARVRKGEKKNGS